jgi:methyl-accepting chemotaxis protein
VHFKIGRGPPIPAVFADRSNWCPVPQPRSLATKLVLAVAPIVALAIAALTWLAIAHASAAQRDAVKRGLADLTARHANAIDASNAAHAQLARGMASELEPIASGQRDFVKRMTRGIAARHPELNGLYYTFAHNAYGPDAPHAGEDTPSGLFAPYWFREEGHLTWAPNDTDMVGQDWWEVPKRTRRDAVTDPYVDPTNHVLMTSYVSPVLTPGGRFRGVAGIDVALSDVQRSVNRLKVLNSGYSALVTGGGAFLAAPRKSLVGRGTLAKLGRSELAPMIRAVRGRRAGQMTVRDPFGDQTAIVSWSPVKTGGWAVVTVAPEDEAIAPVKALRTQLLLGGMVAILLTMAALALVARRLVAPLGGFGRRLRSLADLDAPALAAGMDAIARGDLTVPVDATTPPAPVRGRDEVARASDALNAVIDRTHATARAYEHTRAALADLLGRVAEGAGDVAGASQRVAATSVAAREAVEEISSAIVAVADGADRQTAMVASTHDRTERVGDATRASAESARRTAESAEQAREVAREGAAQALAASEAMRTVRESSATVSEAIDGLAQRSRRIGAIVETITGLAEQTNLLALNAAIEAARAGDRGRGFAVVADEVGKLAEESHQAAATIATLLTEIRAETEQTVAMVVEGAARADETATVVDGAQSAFAQIAAAVEEVTARAAEIATAATRVAEESGEVRRDVGAMEGVAERSAAAAQQVSASAQLTATSTQEIAGAADGLADAAAGLDALVRRFQLSR